MTIKFQRKNEPNGIWYIVSIDNFPAYTSFDQSKAKEYYLQTVAEAKKGNVGITTLDETTITPKP